MLETVPPLIWILIASGLLAAVFGTVQFFYYSIVNRSSRRQDNLAGRLGGAESNEETEASLFADDMRMRGAEALGDMGQRLGSLLIQGDTPWSVTQFMIITLAAGIVPGVLGLIFLGPSALVIGLVIAAVPYLYVSSRASSRQKKLLEQLPEALDLMARSLKAGLSLNDAFKIVADESPIPMSPEFARVFEELRLGKEYRACLESLLARNPGIFELQLFVSSVLLQRETGGNLIEVLESISLTIRKRFVFSAKVKAMTSEARFSALIVGSLPAFVAVILFVMKPAYILTLFNETLGLIMLGVVVVMYTTGILLMAAASKVEV